MATVSSRQDLIDYCLRRLGHPVIEINVSDDQVEDRIDDALQFYREYHYDAVEQVYLKTQITPSSLSLTTNVANSFILGDVITGQTSGATTEVYGMASSGNTISVVNTSDSKDFLAGETVIGSSSGATGTLSALSKGSYDLKCFEMADAVTGVTRILPFFNKTSGINLFDIRYQMLIQDLYNLMSVDVIHYTMIQNHLQLINDILVGVKPIRFNRHMNKLFVDMDWKNDASIGDFVIVECYRILDPNTYTDVYNDMFLKRYATALIKRQWGENMKKFQGVSLPGGVMLNGQVIFDEAISEINQIENEIQDKFELPADFFMG